MRYMFCFATRDKRKALEFIKRLYPDIDKKKINKLMNLIGKDILRITDPYYHDPIQIIQGKQYDSKFDDEIAEAIQEFREQIEDRAE